jgi:hypothetical protein
MAAQVYTRASDRFKQEGVANVIRPDVLDRAVEDRRGYSTAPSTTKVVLDRPKRRYKGSESDRSVSIWRTGILVDHEVLRFLAVTPNREYPAAIAVGAGCGDQQPQLFPRMTQLRKWGGRGG